MSRKERKDGRFNLKAVVQETGVKPDTLRAWERRYGLPTPERTAGGHRLYAQADIEMIKWLQMRRDEGLSISRAVHLWRQLQNDGKNPLEEMPLTSSEQLPIIKSGMALVNLRNLWVESCLAFDEQTAEHILSQALAMYPPELVCMELLQKGISEIGQGWYLGDITVQQEHFSSALAMRRVESLIFATPPPSRSGRILIGCAPEDAHTFPALLLTFFLRRRGWDVLYLGANVPLGQVEATIEAAKPRLIILTAQTLATAATLLRMTETLRHADVLVGFGGFIFNVYPSLITRIPAHFLGTSLVSAPDIIESLIQSPRPYLATLDSSIAYRTVLQHFLEKQAKLEATIWDKATQIAIQSTHLSRINRDISHGIISALTLGDIQLIGSDFHWFEQLLMTHSYRMDHDMLRTYVEIYSHATRDTLGDRGKLIWDWLDTILKNEQKTADEHPVSGIIAKRT